MTARPPLRVAVIGVGSMGRNHARVYWELPDVELVGVADADPALAESVARKFGTRGYSDYHKLLDEAQPQAITLAVPTSLHRDIALEIIRRNIHLLIEKPIAFSIEEGQEIIETAHSAGIKLMVGHIERFNPAVMALQQRIAAGDLGRVIQLDARRQGPFPSRVSDVGVVIDLAVHDIDIMRYVTGQEVQRLYSETQNHILGEKEDLLSAVLRFTGGAIGTLNINWLTPTKIREIRVLGEHGLFIVNYLTQDLIFFKNSAISGEWETMHILRGVTEGEMIKYVFPKKEPLRSEQEAFLSAVRGESEIPVKAEDGLTALKLAQMMLRSGMNNQAHSV